MAHLLRRRETLRDPAVSPAESTLTATEEKRPNAHSQLKVKFTFDKIIYVGAIVENVVSTTNDRLHNDTY